MLCHVGCWCDRFCAAAGDCCDGCNQQCGGGVCPAQREPRWLEPPRGPRFFDRDIFDARPDGSRFTQNGFTLDRELACASAIEGVQPPGPVINIPVVYVRASTTNVPANPFNIALVNRLLAFLNGAYARFGFSFTLVQTYAAAFNTVDDVDTRGCNAGQPENGCQRCAAYKQAEPRWQVPTTLFLYALPDAGEVTARLGLLQYTMPQLCLVDVLYQAYRHTPMCYVMS